VDLHWSVRCGRCSWKCTHGLDDRDHAVELGRAHSEEEHPEDYEFRVQGRRSPEVEATNKVERKPRAAPVIPDDWPLKQLALGCRSCGEVVESVTMLGAHTYAEHGRGPSVLERTPLQRS
jgi:hypothetical protein